MQKRGSNRLEISRDKNVNESRYNITEYIIQGLGNSMKIGLTNLDSSRRKAKSFVIELYRSDCNIDYEEVCRV